LRSRGSAMKDWTIRRRIVVSFGVVLASMVVMAAIAYSRLSLIEAEAKAIQIDSVPGLYYSTAIENAWSNDFALLEQRIFAQETERDRDLEGRLNKSRSDLETLTTTYEKSVNTAADRQAFDAFKTIRTEYLQMRGAVLQAADSPATRAEALALVQSKGAPLFDQGEAAIKRVVDLNKARADESVELIAGAVGTAKTADLISLAIALGVALVSGVLLLRAITLPLGRLTSIVDVLRQGNFTQRLALQGRDEFGTLAEGFNRMADELTALVAQVQRSGLQVNTSVTEIAATAKEHQATANEIAATTTEIGATSREIAATSKELVKTMTDVASVAEQSASLAGAGQTGLSHMEETMRNVMDAAGSVSAKLATLNEKAGDISMVVTTITKVADQTNLLSLNAAIEAEKAGEYGRGFSVVATEIRRLADQTAVATSDIGQMVKAMQSAVSAGVMSMDKFSEEVRRGMHAIQEVGQQLGQIIQQVLALAPRFEAVSEGMQAQATGAEQITEALTQLSDAARQTVESLRQSNMAIDDLNQVAVGLRNGVSRFTLQNA
jgi:methyl-accepting chemotaxis protein WspA